MSRLPHTAFIPPWRHICGYNKSSHSRLGIQLRNYLDCFTLMSDCSWNEFILLRYVLRFEFGFTRHGTGVHHWDTLIFLPCIEFHFHFIITIYDSWHVVCFQAQTWPIPHPQPHLGLFGPFSRKARDQVLWFFAIALFFCDFQYDLDTGWSRRRTSFGPRSLSDWWSNCAGPIDPTAGVEGDTSLWPHCPVDFIASTFWNRDENEACQTVSACLLARDPSKSRTEVAYWRQPLLTILLAGRYPLHSQENEFILAQRGTKHCRRDIRKTSPLGSGRIHYNQAWGVVPDSPNMCYMNFRVK